MGVGRDGEKEDREDDTGELIITWPAPRRDHLSLRGQSSLEAQRAG